MIDGADKLLMEQRNRQLKQAVKIIAELEEKIVSSDKLIGLLREAKAELECGHNATALQCIEDALLLFKVEDKLADTDKLKAENEFVGEKIKRYSFEKYEDAPYDNGLELDENGKWIEYEDYKSIINKLKTQIAAIADDIEHGFSGPCPDPTLIRNGINRLRQLSESREASDNNYTKLIVELEYNLLNIHCTDDDYPKYLRCCEIIEQLYKKRT